MKNFFKPEMFKQVFKTERDNDYEDIADYLNALIESCPVVYGQIKNIDGGLTDKKYWCATQIGNNGETHQARLFNIEEIVKEPCKHEPSPHISCSMSVDQLGNEYFQHKTKCQYCGVELQATWSEKNA